jgi:hypothetical protein
MRAYAVVPAAALLASLAACAPAIEPAGAPPASTAPHASEAMPQPPNSLPLGDVVNAPVSSGAVTTPPQAY